ncbi:hypothetical protein MBLNU459_g6725t1 [Dothideomycetes sp. NU459]
MAIRGQHFSIDQFDEDNNGGADFTDDAPVNPFGFIADIQERATSTPQPPQPPSLRNAQGGGFPAHRKRQAPSRFKRARQQDGDSEVHRSQDVTSPPESATRMQVPEDLDDDDFAKSEKRQIDADNRMRIAAMSEEEIEEERRELFKQLDPSLIERLLRRANIEPEGGPSNADFPGLENEDKHPKTAKPRKSVKFVEPADAEVDVATAGAVNASHADDVQPHEQISDDEDASLGEVKAAQEALLTDSTVHFPQPPQPPSLDPSSETFLTDLHEKYFPSLPADPSKLEWMTSTASDKTAYSTTQSSLDPKDIRFSFAGSLIPPSLASEIPVTAGLHHHGNAPDAAGYTIPELGMLARSSVAAQRCVAFQTLGRILYRLGRGEFGDPGEEGAGTVGAEDTMGELARGLWSEVEKENVVDVCVAESEGRSLAGGKHVSARSYATEAVWLWQKGGGRRWKAA